MIHKQHEFLSGIARSILIIPILACLLTIQGCGQSRTVTKQSDKVVKNETLTAAPTTTPDIIPVFPGGDNALLEYINSHLTYPNSAVEQKIEGRVTLRFVIDTDGFAKKFEVVKSVNPDLDDAAIQALRGMPKWIPGQKNGVNVPVYYNMPIMFKLNR